MIFSTKLMSKDFHILLYITLIQINGSFTVKKWLKLVCFESFENWFWKIWKIIGWGMYVSSMVVEDLLQANMFLSFRSSAETRCDVKQQTYEEKTVLHICKFPSSDVFMYVEMQLRVIDRGTDATIYNRTVSVEDQSKCYGRATIYFEVFIFVYCMNLN